MISIKNVIGMEVIDQKGQKVGKVKNIDCDDELTKVTTLNISLDKGLFSNDEKKVGFNDIKGITDYVLLDIEISLDEED